MKFLIPTEPDDSHAIIVKLALESIGHNARLFFTADHPTRQKNSVFIQPGDYQWKSTDKYTSILENHYDVVWWRRARKPHLPKGIAHTEDAIFMARENYLFHNAITDNIAPNAWWINSKSSARRANSKLLQLKIAKQVGMLIPTTLCSNDPLDIRHFVLKHEEDGVIYKPLCSNFWFESDAMKIAYTSKVNFLDLPSNTMLQHNPGIYQKEIKKKYELRITCFGDYIVAVKLNSQCHNEGKTDWRAIRDKKMQIEPYIIPTKLEKSIKQFMSSMGLVFGSMDFIVTNDSQYVFLEINEQGQFLWIEEYNADVKMLDIFVQYLLSQHKSFHWDARQQEHTINKYRHELQTLTEELNRRHINLNIHATH